MVQCDTDLASKFIGDIGQPLHCENLDVGGNDIDVTYDGDSTNLHAIWDTQIPESIAGSSSLSGAKTWASTLTTGKSTRELLMPPQEGFCADCTT